MAHARGRLPTLRPGVDSPPAWCPACGSDALIREDATDGEAFGAVVCRMCGAVAAFLRAASRPGSTRAP
jgi:hypothetical protein